MKHFFIINPCAGKKNHVSDISEIVKALDADAEIYVTRDAGDATRFVDEYCSNHPDESVRFYACGGDGTLNEVVTGSVGHPLAEVGCYPCGSGNDYVKYWPHCNFLDIKALTKAPSVKVDVMKVCYKPSASATESQVRYAINTLNFGFEAEVCSVMAEVRRKPLIGGHMAYTTAIVKCLVSGRHNPCRILTDGNPWRDGDIMLASLANGRYQGSGFLSAPRSLNDDGLLEVTAISPISVLRFASMIKYYKNGEYIERTDLQDVITYCRARRVTFESAGETTKERPDDDRPFSIGIDGEILIGTHFEVENLHHAVSFIIPKH